MADFASISKRFQRWLKKEDFIGGVLALAIGQFIGSAIVEIIVAIVWASVSLFVLACRYSSFTGISAISIGVFILVLAAWRALKAGIKASDGSDNGSGATEA